MKYRTTAKAIRQYGTNPISIGYCDASYLLVNHSPDAYTCGIYGWNFDVYEVHGYTICTGYRGMVGREAKNAREYNRRAEQILSYKNTDDTYEEKRKKVEALLIEFLEQA